MDEEDRLHYLGLKLDRGEKLTIEEQQELEFLQEMLYTWEPTCYDEG